MDSIDRKILDSNKIDMGMQSKPRRAYRKPQLEILGDLRSLTLGGSPGIGESGSGNPHKPRTNRPLDYMPQNNPYYIPPPD